MSQSLLIIEDNPSLREIMSDYFTAKGFAVTEAVDGAEALEKLEGRVYHIVLLDIMMPRVDGFAVCRAIRRDSPVPVIFLTARSREEDMLRGYELGADDYITKPFSLPVLHAKVLALLARAGGRRATYRLGRLHVDADARTVTAHEKPVELAAREFDMLLYLLVNKGLVLTRNQILDAVWGLDFFGDSRVVDTHIKKLRAALGPCAGLVQTVRKVGYKLEAER